MTPLDPLSLPLFGSRLIEASAGTGKTFTLAMLYLRLILRHGQARPDQPHPDQAQSFGRALLPPEILVVTFTNAATDELRDRIRRRLMTAAALFRGQAERQPDTLLLRLRDELLAQGRDLAQCARQLDRAGEWMDEAAISTIHAWCYRMLREHAFESGHAFDRELTDSAPALLQQATEDYWRANLLGLSSADLRQVRERWPDPTALKKVLKSLLPLADRIPPGSAPALALQQSAAALTQALSALKSAWRAQRFVTQLETLFDTAARAKAFDQTRLNRRHRALVLDSLRRWMETPEQVYPDILCNQSVSWRRMSSLEVAAIWRPPAAAPVAAAACQALAVLKQQLDVLPKPDRALLAHAVHWVRERIESAQQQRAELTQHDLLVLFDRALQAPRGEALAATVRRQFPVALVDEFQDTDPLQYRIFDRIYRIGAADPETCLLLIGDPKQAIYAFRGADIYTYLIARRETAGRQATLDTNYRSTPALLAAINALFAFGERHAAQGAFLFRDGATDPLPFLPSKPDAGNPGPLTIDGQPCPPLQAWLLEERKKMRYGERIAQIAAREIAQLLALGQAGRARLPAENGAAARDVKPGDIAVLVNNRTEAKLMRDALRELNVACVYLSERNSVFDTPVARELLALLCAIDNPANEPLLRQALAISLLGRSLEELDRCNHDERYWEAQGERFHTYRILWRRQGLLPLLYRILSDFAVAARLLAARHGERTLTDLLHLGELLHAASRLLDGELALVRYLAEAIASAETDDMPHEARQLRLESDEQLVRVVTIHQSKGLEYSLVLLPFIVNCRAVKAQDLPLKTHDERQQLQVHLGCDDALLLQQADRERLGEDLRKLYVALTRARHACWLGIAPTPELKQSALGYLLGLTDHAPSADQSLADRLNAALARASEWLALKQPLDADPAPYRPLGDRHLTDARPPPKMRRSRWWIASYTALAAGVRAEAAPDFAETAALETTLEETAPTPATAPRSSASASSLHELPRGSRFGTFLHGILEWAAGVRAHDANGLPLRGFAAAAQSPAQRYAMLEQRCTLYGLSDWIEPLDAWLAKILVCPWKLADLPAGDTVLALCDLAPGQVQVEMEFWMESRKVDSRALERLVQSQTLAGEPRPEIADNRLNGMFKGFVDLVFEHRGRYYVADWKSNWLGPDDSAYTPAALRTAILNARYDLQYVMYLLALHRQLQLRLPGYDYDRHLGGAIYVFLRGADSDSQGLFMDKPPKALIESLDRMFRGAAG